LGCFGRPRQSQPPILAFPNYFPQNQCINTEQHSMARSTLTGSTPINRILAVTVIAILITIFVAKQFSRTSSNFDVAAQKMLDNHIAQFKDMEYFSGGALSIYIPNEKIHNYYSGTISHDKDSKPVTDKTLFQIGSITKSFTGALALQLQKEKKLSLQEQVGKYHSAYPKWATITLTQLLNMTSGLPNYSDAPFFNTDITKNPDLTYTSEQLLNYAYPKGSFTPPLKAGYAYTNTGYVLLDMIIEKQTRHTYKEEITTRFITPLKLTNTFYPLPKIDNDVHERMAHGYNYNQYDNPALLGADTIYGNLTWAAAAGGLVASTEDIIKWAQALYIGKAVLDEDQKHELMSLVSTQSGKPISTVSASHPDGFGLGVAAKYNPEHPLETMWFYEGSTLGFRALYIYIPCNQVIIATAFNSATNSENDHAHNILIAAYDLVVKSHLALRCH
jgi:D-alanyl-D-alanine carboxypeptidase